MEKIKSRLIALAFLFVCALTVTCIAADSFHETYMTTEQAKKKFGSQLFVAEKFKAGDRKLRGKMAADLVSKKSLVGKPLASIRETLGTPDGYFENDSIPAYIISPDVTKRDTWQLILLPDKDWKKVDEVKIHKNCCS